MTIHDDSSDLVVTDEGEVKAEAAPAGLPTRIAYTLGSIGLATATAADAIAVAGRHTGFHLLGSIEVVQAAIVLIASSAMVVATLVQSHASVHILTERLHQHWVERLGRVSALLSAVLFVIVAVGSIWVATDLWNGFERTELLHIPLKWLRLLWISAAVLIAVLFIRAAWRNKP